MSMIDQLCLLGNRVLFVALAGILLVLLTLALLIGGAMLYEGALHRGWLGDGSSNPAFHCLQKGPMISCYIKPPAFRVVPQPTRQRNRDRQVSRQEA